MAKKTDFDKYVEQAIKKEPYLKEELEKADRAWDIALQIRTLRKKRGLTQQKLAELAGISQPNIARIESADYHSYTLKTLEKITNVLKAKIDVVVVPKENYKKHKMHLPRPVFAFN